MKSSYTPWAAGNVIAGGRPRSRDGGISPWADKGAESSLCSTSSPVQKAAHKLTWIARGEGAVGNREGVVQPYFVGLVLQHGQLIIQTCRRSRGESRGHGWCDSTDVVACDGRRRRRRSQNPHDEGYSAV